MNVKALAFEGNEVGWVVRGSPIVYSRDLGLWMGERSVGVFIRDTSPYLRKFRGKTTENFKRLGLQARPKIEPVSSRLPV